MITGGGVDGISDGSAGMTIGIAGTCVAGGTSGTSVTGTRMADSVGSVVGAIGIQFSVVWHLEHCPRGWLAGLMWQDLQSLKISP